jgi:hypothetical protein
VINVSMMNRKGVLYGPARPGPASRRTPGSWPQTSPTVR